MQQQITQLLQQWDLHPWAWNAILVGGALLLAIVVRGLFWLLMRKKTIEEGNFSLFGSMVHHLGRPLSFFLPLFCFNLLLPLMQLPPVWLHRLSRGVEIGLIITFAWLLVSAIYIAQDYVLHRFDIKKTDNLRERKIRTQLQFLRRFTVGVIVLLTVAAVLLTFSAMRKIGTGLLTGVGVSGIIIGFAAQRTLGNLLAGLQIAFTQPIRIDDSVLVEGEFGTIEEITMTYVVVRVWDERRLILPINYFIEKPFQNWTRSSAQLLGTILLYVDYTIPVDKVRKEVDRLLKSHPLWDHRAVALQVTDMKPDVTELRVLVSARNSGDLFNLRCDLREQLLGFLQAQTQFLPQTRTVARVELEQATGEGQPAAAPANQG